MRFDMIRNAAAFVPAAALTMKHFITLVVLGMACACAGDEGFGYDPVDYVNPLIGACTSTEAAGVYHGLGKTFPGATTPFGMVQVSPQTVTGGDNSCGYSYEMKTIEGFDFTQMSGVGWYGDLGNFLVMPTSGPMKTVAGKEDGSIEGWRSSYDKESEIARPGYYRVRLNDYNVTVECSATPHCGAIRFTYDYSGEARTQIDLARRVGGTSERQYLKIVDDHTVEGWMRCPAETGGWGNGEGNSNYTVYFHAEFSRPLESTGFWSADIPAGWQRKMNEVNSPAYLEKVAASDIIRDIQELEGDHIGFFTEYPVSSGDDVTLKVGISFVDIDGARKNFASEIAGLGFDEVVSSAEETWRRELSKIKVAGGTDEEKTVFYTALYHSLIDPRIYADVDGRYVGGDLKVHNPEDGFTKRTIFSGWDVFRSQMPLQTIINPQVVNDIVASLTTLAEQSGREYYERWEIFNSYSGCMIGNPALSVIADAYAKGIRNFDAGKAFRYGRNTVEKFGNWPLGWTPGSLCISQTLEYAYFDWCLGRFAEMLGHSAEAAEYKEKAEAYRNIFDKDKMWFRPREADGTWAEWPDSARTTEWYGCIECNPYQQGWFVPHNVEAMTELMGGREAVLADLDAFFSNTPEDMLWNQYYNHANEPVHFVPFLFNALGEPWKTQKWTRFICSHGYSDNVMTGLVGNDDAGQMSAWYVLAASGIHPSCPGNTSMDITSPVFDEIRFKTDPVYTSGKEFIVKAYDNSPGNIYIQKALLNGKPLPGPYVDFSDIAAGGKLELYMGSEPTEWK